MKSLLNVKNKTNFNGFGNLFSFPAIWLIALKKKRRREESGSERNGTISMKKKNQYEMKTVNFSR